jgi:hypothetical protein
MSKNTKRRGGFLGIGSLVNQAIVPFTITAAQQTYRKRKGGKRTRKTRRGRKSSRRH